MAQTYDSPYEDKLYKCQRCGELKVRKKIGSRYTPKYCPDCLKKIRRLSIKKANKARFDKKFKEKFEEVTAPDGSKVFLRDEEEKQFYLKRKKQYLEDFEWVKSADMGLLSKLLTLEIQARRIERELAEGGSGKKAKLLTELTKEMRNVQKELGIDRATRIKANEEEDVVSIIQDIIRRFKKYREENQDKFVWRCRYCGQLNVLYRINKWEDEYVTKEESENKDRTGRSEGSEEMADKPSNEGDTLKKEGGEGQ
mgnify:CR=1 FL=1